MREAAGEVVLVDPVLEVADPEGADLFQGRRLVVLLVAGGGGGGNGGGGPRWGLHRAGCC